MMLDLPSPSSHSPDAAAEAEPWAPRSEPIVCPKPLRRPLSLRNARALGTTAATIRAESVIEGNALGFLSQLLVQASLPHRDPGDVVGWARRNGDYTLLMQPGLVTDETGAPKSIGLPFGTYARLVCCWMCTEAIRTGSRHLDLGQTFNQFMRKLRLQRSGGEKGTELALNRQLQRLSRASISWSFTPRNWTPNADIGTGVFPIETRQVFWDPEHPERRTPWSSTLSLSPTFFEHVSAHHVPIDLRVVRELARQHTCLGMDIYCWLTARVFRLKRTTPPIPWPRLMQQLGTGHRSAKEFARDFKKELVKVRILYPEVRVELVRGGIRLLPSPTHVPQRGTHQ